MNAYNNYHKNIEILKEKEPTLLERINDIASNYELASSLACEENISFDKDISNSNIIVVLGFGVGDHVKALLKQVPEKTLIIIADPDLSIFKAALYLRDLSHILDNNQVLLCLGENPEIIKKKIEDRFGLLTISNIETIENEIFIKNSPDYFEKVKNILKEINIYAYINIGTLKRFTKAWPRNFLKNIIPFVKNPGIITLHNKFPQIPAIIVSSGPSLNKNVKLLKKAKNYFIIICVDTALSVLMQNKIEPHLVFTVESNPENLDCFKSWLSTNFFLCASMFVYYPTIKNFKGSIFIDNGGYPLAQWIEKFIDTKGFLNRSGSVATNCFSLAQFMGCNPIVFVGQDLSFPRNIFYAKGVSSIIVKHRNDIMAKNKDIVYVKDNYGHMIKTNHFMKGWKLWFEEGIKETPHITYINATEGGAKIEGTRFITLKETIKQYGLKKINVSKVLNKIQKDHKIPSLEDLIKEFKSIIEEYQIASHVSIQGKIICDNLVNSLGHENTTSPRISQLFNRARILYEEISNLKKFMYFSHWNFERMMFEIEKEFKEKTSKSIVNSYQCFFQEVINITTTMLRHLIKAEKEIKKLNKTLDS
ncbi:MAG: DUF115 domain-containing protein [bacterium]|nr:DUF115 domain-containing protein [bacterium]